MVWASDEKRAPLCRKEGDGNGSAREKEYRLPKKRLLNKVKYDIKEKGLSADEVYGHATWRRMSSYIDPHIKVRLI